MEARVGKVIDAVHIDQFMPLRAHSRLEKGTSDLERKTKDIKHNFYSDHYTCAPPLRLRTKALQILIGIE